MRGLRAARDIDETFGGKLFQWWNPDAVQAEYDLQAGSPGGREAPRAPQVGFDDVLAAGRRDALETAAQAGAHLSAGLKLAGIAVGIGVILYALNTVAKYK